MVPRLCTTLTLKGMDPTKLDQLVLPIGMSGPIDALRIDFDGSDLADALKKAGKKELAGRLTKELDGLGLPTELPGDLGQELEEGIKGALEGLLGGKKKD